MAKFEIKFDVKKLEKELKKQSDRISQEYKNELFIQNRKESDNTYMNLPKKEEDMLNVFIEKYNTTKNYNVQGNMREFPKYMQYSIRETMNNLKIYGYIANFNNFIDGGWDVNLTPDGIDYFEKKGMNDKLFEELADEDKKLLKKIVELKSNNDITEYLANLVDNDDENEDNRKMIETLKSNGLINIQWADDTVCNAELTHSGKTFFERKEKYNQRMNKFSNISYNIQANNSEMFFGNIINSNIDIKKETKDIEEQIDKKCESDVEKIELKELLEEAQEIIENINDTNKIEKRKNFFNKLVEHFDKHGWFYGEIVNLFGTFLLNKISGGNINI